MTAGLPSAPDTGLGTRERYLWETLRTLWPPPAHITRRGRMAGCSATAAEFLVCPSERHAALLVPRRPLGAAAAALRNYKASGGAAVQARYRALALAAGVGLAEVLPDRIRIEPGPAGPDGNIVGHLRAALRRDALVSLYIGPPRANRKPVLQVLTPQGEVIGFVKVGVNPLTRRLVRAEAAALSFLAGVPLTHLRPPRLLYHGRWRGNEILAQQAFPISWRTRTSTDLNAAMTEVAGLRGISSLPAVRSPYWLGLRSRLHSLARRDIAGPLVLAVDRLERAAADTTLAFGSWHGDWTPWNMSLSRRGVLVWDWERFETGVPVGYDAVHYRLQDAVVGSGMAAETAAETAISASADLLAPFGIDPRTARLVATLYLIEIAVRYTHDGQAEAGAKLGRVDAWLLPVVTRQATAFADRRGG